MKKYPGDDFPLIAQLNEGDMPEVLAHFIPQGQDDSQWVVKTMALSQLLIATGGHMYAFVTIASHLMAPEQAKHLTDVNAYLTSSDFYNSSVYKNVHNRCYNLGYSRLHILSHALLQNPCTGMEYTTKQLLGTGIWQDKTFHSPLLIQQIFRQLIQNKQVAKETTMKVSSDIPVVEQIIIAGLRNMHYTEFAERYNSYVVNYFSQERGLAFRWGVSAGAALKRKGQVRLTAEVVTQSVVKTTVPPTTNFRVYSGSTSSSNGSNGSSGSNTSSGSSKFPICMHVAVDRSSTAMHALVDQMGDAAECGHHYLLHFVDCTSLEGVMRNIQQFPVCKQSHVYTFMKQHNTLLCGTNIVRKRIVPKLQLPSSRGFNTITVLRRLSRVVEAIT